MKVLAFGDIHARPHNNFSSPLSNFTTTFLEKVRKSLGFVCDCIEETQPNIVIFLGDLTHQHGIVDSMTGSMLKNSFIQIRDLCESLSIPFESIEGNHDLEKIGMPGVGNLLLNSAFLPVYMGYSDNILLVPYVEDQKAINNVISMIEEYKPELICSHLDLYGGIWNAKKKSDTALNLGDYNVLNGHIHQPSIYRNNIFVGSLLASTFSDIEVNQARGVCVWEDGEVEWFVNPHTDHFLKVSIQNEDDALKILNSLENPKQTYLNLVMQESVYLSKEVEELKREIGGFVISSIIEETKEVEENAENESQSLLTMNADEVVELYCKKNGIDGKDKEYGKGYLK